MRRDSVQHHRTVSLRIKIKRKQGAGMKKEKVEKVMKLERLLGTWRAVVTVNILIDVLIFMTVNYVFNLILYLPRVVQDLDHPLKYLGLRNLFPRLEMVTRYKQWYLLLLAVYIIACLIIDIRQAYQMRTAFSEKGFNLGQKGVARWTTNQEIKEQYKEIPDKDISFSGTGGTIISRIGDRLYLDTSPVNNLLIGITRSGKGEMFVLPSIDVYSRAEEKTSLVICDPKMELYKSSKHTLEERGYEVYLLNLDDPLYSMGFNPLEQILKLYLEKDYANAELLAQAFSYSIFNPDKPASSETFWNDMASSLLTALILGHLEDCIRMDEIENERNRKVWEREGHKEPYQPSYKNIKKVTMYSIINTFTELARIKDQDDPDINLLDDYFNKRPALNRAKLKYAGVEIAGYRTKSSIFATLLSKLTVFTYENVAKMTAESSIHLEDIGFGEKPVAVFLGIPDYDKSTHFLASVFIRQMYFVLAKRATKSRTGKCTRRVKVICDEFGNIPAIEGMENIITVCLGRNISFDLVIQSYSQLKKLYGENDETIIGNCGNQIYILTDDENTADSFSKLLGNETIIDMQRSGERISTHKHFMENTQEKPLLNPNELMELYEGECVVKRVMKRTDKKGKKIRPTPIFNSTASGKRFLFRYEYLTDTFPNPDTIDLYQINSEDRSHIDLKERVWDPGASFKIFAQSGNAEEKVQLTIAGLSNKEQMLDALKNAVGLEQIPEDTTIDQLINLITRAEIKPAEKESLLSLLSIGSRAVS